MFAIWAAECVVVPINYKLHPREMAEILDDAGAARVFASTAIAGELAPITTTPMETFDSQDYSRRLTVAPSAKPRTDPSALAWLFYTSGTTGRSKGAMLSHRNLTAMTVAHLADIDDPDERCSLLHAAPMSHGSGSTSCRTCCAPPARWCPPRAHSTPTSSSICASITPSAARFSPRRWCSAWWARAAPARPT